MIEKGNRKTMLTDDQKHIIVETIKQLTNPTDLEKDILDSIEELSKQSLDWQSARARIAYIYDKYEDIFAKVNSLPTTVQKDTRQITEIDLRYVLHAQLNFLLEKEWKEHYNG